jgi:Zn-dependent peptidase ImmA (M78 family)
MRRDDVERIAEDLVARLPETSRCPVDVRGVARQLGLPVVPADLGEDVSACLVTEGKRSCIGVHDKDHPNRQRFSIAHEIGHYVLKHGYSTVHIDRKSNVSFRAVIYRTGKGTTGDLREVEANQFAACLLMPSKRIRDEVSKLPTEVTDDEIESLAQKFKVSPAAMAIRLQVLGLF